MASRMLSSFYWANKRLRDIVPVLDQPFLPDRSGFSKGQVALQ